MIIGTGVYIGKSGPTASIFVYGNLLSTDTVTCVDSTETITIQGVWSSKIIEGAITNGWLFKGIVNTGTYNISATRGLLSTTTSVLVDMITDYDVPLQMPNVPSGYTELSYIESTGTQYIDTGAIINSENIEIEFEINVTEGTGCIWGTGGSDLDLYSNLSSTPNIRFTRLRDSGDFDFSTSLTLNTWNTYYAKLIQGSQIVKKDGVTIATGTSSISYTLADFNLFFFARSTNSSPTVAINFSKIKCRKLIVYNLSGVAVRNFIPCYRKSDGEVGMWDSVTQTFFTNQGTGKFCMGGIVDSEFTNTYQQVEYLQSTGTQYINSGITENANIVWENDVEFTSSTTEKFMGCGESNYVRINFGISSSKLRAAIGAWVDSGVSTFTTRHYWVIDVPNKRYYIDSVSVSTSAYTYSSTDGRKLYIFARNATSIDGKCSCKLRSSKFIQNGTATAIFVPCYRKSDSVRGLYDMVSKTFKVNSGSGTFGVGADIDV